MALRVAAALRLADHIAAGVTTIQVPAERSGTDANGAPAARRDLPGQTSARPAAPLSRASSIAFLMDGCGSRPPVGADLIAGDQVGCRAATGPGDYASVGPVLLSLEQPATCVA